MVHLPRRSRARRERISAGKALGEWERRALSDLREAARAQVGEQGELVDLVALIPLRVAQGVLVCRRPHHVPGDQAVRSEAVDNAVQLALEEQVTPLDQDPVHPTGGE